MAAITATALQVRTTRTRHDYNEGVLWKDWRTKDKFSGTVVEKPSNPSLFATSGAKVPHRNPDTKMVDSAEEKKQKAKEKKELQERLGKERFARLQQLQKVVEGRSNQLLGLCVRIARSQLGYTFGLEIDEPSSDAMALINARIQALLPGARPR